MYCPNCQCDYVGWEGKCPIDHTYLLETSPVPEKPTHTPIPYDHIVKLVREHGGSYEINLRAIEVGRGKKMSFPYRGYGFAWAKRMVNGTDGVNVDLHIAEIEKSEDWGFPYQGYGFAWEKRMRGWVGGHEVELTATKVTREKKFLFPYRGHGYAWAERMTGKCGELIRVDLNATEIGRDRAWFMFYFGFGYAWISRATLVLSLSDQQTRVADSPLA